MTTTRQPAGMSAERLAVGLDLSPAAIAAFDERGVACYANAAFCELTGRSLPELQQLTYPELAGGPPAAGSSERVAETFADLLSGATETLVQDGSYARPDGTAVLVRAKSVRLPGSPTRVLVTAFNMTEQQAHAETLAYQASHDDLTGLPVRGLFLELLAMSLRRLHRQPDGCIAVGFLDVDGLKAVNDTYGHAVGDELIEAVPVRMRQAVRPSDVIARVGGDEFTLLIDSGCDAGQELAVGKRLVRALSEPFQLSVGPVRVGASLGLVTTRDPHAMPDLLVSQADAAMYAAKKSGGNQVSVFDERADQERVARHRLETELRVAVDNGELWLAYQPIIDLTDDHVLGVEALLRWEHRTRGPLVAADFIATAEHSGLIIPVGRWVLDQACRQLHRWDCELGSRAPQSLFINVSARQVEASDLAGDLGEAVRRAGIDPTRVCLEITETELLHDPDRAHAVLRRVSELGCRLAIDDFGTGYASLSRLTQIRAGAVKLDASFVRQVRHRRDAAAVIAATLLLAHNLRQDVIAEGVEDPRDLAVLREMGCDYGQGFHVSKPLHPADLSRWLVTRERAARRLVSLQDAQAERGVASSRS